MRDIVSYLYLVGVVCLVITLGGNLGGEVVAEGSDNVTLYKSETNLKAGQGVGLVVGIDGEGLETVVDIHVEALQDSGLNEIIGLEYRGERVKGDETVESIWELPEVYVDRHTGELYYGDMGSVGNDIINGGRILYTPLQHEDGDYDLKVVITKDGEVVKEIIDNIKIEGHLLESYVVRAIDPNNPFPEGNVGGNWKGHEDELLALRDWYSR